MQKQSLSTSHGEINTCQLLSKRCLISPKPILSLFIAEHDVIMHGISLWLVLSHLPGYVTSQHPQSVHCWGAAA